MALPVSIDDREYQKFEDTPGGPAVRVTGTFYFTAGDSPFGIPALSKSFTVTKAGVTKEYRFFDASLVLLKTITLTFEDDSYEELVSGTWV